MQHVITRHPARWLVALLAVLILAIGLVSTSQAAAPVKCDPPALKVNPQGVPSTTGGTVIQVVVTCTGNAAETLRVAVERGGVRVFEATLVKTVSGTLHDTDTIHLPPPPELENICAEIQDQRVCVPPE